MPNCAACKQTATNAECLKCSLEKCENTYHYECLGVARSAFVKITSKQKSSWKCPSCTQQKTKKCDSTPVRPTSDANPQSQSKASTQAAESDILAQPAQIEPSNTADAVSSPTPVQSVHVDLQQTISANNDRLIAQLSKLMDDKLGETSKRLLEKQEAIVHQYNTVMESLNKYSLLFDETVRAVETIKAEMKDVRKTTDEVRTLHSTVEDLKATINTMEQRDRLLNLEVFGVPERKSEAVTEVVLSIARAVGVPLVSTDVVSAVRIPTRNTAGLPKPIIVKFHSLDKRDAILTAVRKNRGIKTNEIGMQGDPRQIHVNEHLTPANKTLLKDTKLKAKELGFRYCWTRNGRVFVRQGDNFPPIRINRTSQLLTLRKVNDEQ